MRIRTYLKSIMMMTWITVLLLSLPATTFSADALNTFTFQGRLENADGVPVSSTLNMTFKLYDNQNNSLWSDSLSVSIVAGSFDLLLGKSESNPIPFTVNQHARYIGLAVGSDPEMEPRQEIGGVLRAGMALSVTDAAITTSKLADSAVTSNKIANNAISSDKIADNTVSSSKLAGSSSALTSGTNGQTLISNGDGSFRWGHPITGIITASEGVKLGTFSTCNSTYEGLIRYNSSSKTVEFCNGTDWTEMSGSSDSGACGSNLLMDDQQTVSGWTVCYLPGTASDSLRNAACSTLFDSSGKNYGCWHSNSTYPHDNSSAISSACSAGAQNSTTYSAWSGTSHILIVCIQD